jgi:hypothetical protein
MKYVSVKYIADELVTQFGVEMELSSVLQMSVKALKLMGVFAAQRKTFGTFVKNMRVCLPPDAYKARGCRQMAPIKDYSQNILITDPIPQPPQTFFVSPAPIPETSTDECLVIQNKDILGGYSLGPYVPYIYEHPYLHFNVTNVEVVVEYSGLALDKNGIPMIPDFATEGCLYYCLYTDAQAKLLLRKIDPAIYAEIKQWKNDKINQSIANGVMEGLNRGEMDSVLNIMVNMDRKAFGIPS